MNEANALPARALDKLLGLAGLAVDAEERRQVEADLRKIIAFVNTIRAVDTAAVAPLAHPVDAVQPLREDVVTERVDRERYQAEAPAVRDGLYLVPRVVE